MQPGLRVLPALALALASASCTLLFDAGELPGPKPIDAPEVDAPTDARDEDAPVDAPIDANTAMLALGAIEPATLEEGVGSVPGSRKVVLLLAATNLIDEATVDVTWEPVDPVPANAPIVDPAVVSGAHGRIAIPIGIPEIAAFAHDDVRTLRITVTADGFSATKDVTVIGRDRLPLAGLINADDARFDRTYSSIATTGPVTVAGNRPLRLVAHGTIQIDHDLDASAGTGGAAGPGGCVGGGVGTAGSCIPGGGGASLALAADGGGGGFGTAGMPGANGGGAGGAVSGDPMLVPLGAAGNRGNGGGGGATGLLGLGGAAGGHGAGVVYVAGGRVVVGASGRILAHGGPQRGDPVAGGSGGGGSGGAIVVRSALPIGRTAAWLFASGAAGVDGGGNGGQGRARVDDPSGMLPAAATPAPVLGPSWAAGAPLITRSPALTLTARATSGCYAVIPTARLVPTAPDGCSGNGAGPDRTIELGGRAIGFQLAPGHNDLCILWTRTSMLGTTADLPEARSCVDVVYVAP